MLFHCNNQLVCDIWQKGSTRQPETMALVRMLYFCAARFVMITHISGTTNAIADALSRLHIGRFKQLASNAADLPDLIPAWPTQFWTDCSFCTNVAPSTRRTYKTKVCSYLLFCDQFTIPPFPASSLTLRYFCSYIASHVSHKTIKVYLSGIQLEHLERGHHDPTDDKLLHLLCKGIKRSQGDNSRLRLPITINVLKALKTQF